MATTDSRIRLTQSGDLLRATVQRVSDLSLLDLHELADAVARAPRHPDAPDETVAGFALGTLRPTLQDVSGGRCFADIRTRRAKHEAASADGAVRDDLLDRMCRAAESGEAQEAWELVASALERFPGDSLVAVGTGLVRWGLGESAGARPLFERAQSPEADAGLKADALFLQALVTADLGDVERAVNLLARSAVTETSLEDDWTRPAARARYEQARLLAVGIAGGALGPEHVGRCREALFAAVEANGLYFGPAYVDPVFGLLDGLRAQLQDRFNAISLEANLIANAGTGFVRDLQARSLVEANALQRAREVFEAKGFFSRSRLLATGVRTATRLREVAVEGLSERFRLVVRERDAAYAEAESVRNQGAVAADSERSHGEHATQALDMRAFALRQEVSDRFRLSKPLQPQYDELAEGLRTTLRKQLILFGGAGLVLLVGVLLVPAVWFKLAGGLVVLGGVAWLAFSKLRELRSEIGRLDEELGRAQVIQGLEQNIALTTQRTEVQSDQLRERAEREYRERLAWADNRFAEDRSDVRRRVEALIQANDRFFRTIRGEALAEAAFEAPNVDDVPPPGRAEVQEAR